jgi:hypothetical protein
MNASRARHLSALFIAIAALSVPQIASAALHWEMLPAFADPRTGSGVEGASASLIGSKIYVSHGYEAGIGDTHFLSIFDIPTETWTYGGPTAPDDPAVLSAEGGGGNALGKHYSIGGREGAGVGPILSSAVQEFTPGVGWRTMSSMPTARRGIGTASLGGLIYAAGGSTGGAPLTGAPLPDFASFNPALGPTGTWFPLAPMLDPNMDVESTIALDAAHSGSVAGKVYVFGGFPITTDVQIFDIATGMWSHGMPMPTGRSNAMAGFINGKIAVFGGFDPMTGHALSVTELYDPLAGTWSAGPAMLVPQDETAVGVTWDATGVYAIGQGLDGFAGMSVERLVPEPGSAVLAVVGLGGLLVFAWRRKHPAFHLG